MDNDLEDILKSIKGLSLENKREILHFLQNDKTITSSPVNFGKDRDTSIVSKDYEGLEKLLNDFVVDVRSRFELKLKGI